MRLQQIAGRDKKVDLKTFSIQGVELSLNPTALFTETVGERQARVLNLNELKDKIEKSWCAIQGISFHHRLSRHDV